MKAYLGSKIDLKIKPLNNINKCDFCFYGGKSANLSKAIHNGYTVPNGFVIPFDYDINLNKDLILHSLDKLRTEYVAIRSSANIEDSLKLSFAGQFESYLNITRENLIQTIIKCRNSKDTNKVISYLKLNRIKLSEIKMGIIVQEMVEPDYSGVAFSIDPIFGGNILLELSKGLGDKLVSGNITPNTYRIDKYSLKVQESIVNFKIANIEGILKKIALTVLKLEKDFGFPVDIEFSIINNDLIILQVRPITTMRSN